MSACLRYPLFVYLILGVLLSACAPQTPTTVRDGAANISTASQESGSASTPTPPVFTAHPPAGLPTSEATPSPQTDAAATVTFEKRLPPERWREWPVVPTLTAHAMEIYQKGLALGNNPRHFSKVGDCQSVNASFLGMFDRPGRYVLTDSYQNLQETIDYFSGSFDRASESVRGGFNAAAVLSPLWANPQQCQAGENPLECEIRIYQPSFVFISLEVWWNGRTPEKYTQLLSQIVDDAIAQGVVPILATKADNVEGDHSLNLATARVAAQYDLPLWNFWRAVQPLPDHGLDRTRPDGFHISVDAWNVRSFTALQSLDSVWRGLRRAGIAPEPASPVTRAATPTPAASAAATAPVLAALPKLSFGADPGSATGQQIFFDVLRRDGQNYLAQGVYRLDLRNQQLATLLDKDYRLQAVAPDARWLLVSQGNHLYVDEISSGQRTQVSAAFQGQALWLPDGRVVLLTGTPERTSAVLISFQSGNWIFLSGAHHSPQRLYASADGQTVYWEDNDASIWKANLEGKEAQRILNAQGPIFAAEEHYYAFGQTKENAHRSLAIGALDSSQTFTPLLKGTLLADAAWSPDGKILSVLTEQRSDYSGKSGGIHNSIIVAPDMNVKEYPLTVGLSPRTAWSPDGQELLQAATLPGSGGSDYQISLRRITVATGKLTLLDEALQLTSPEYILVGNFFWK